ncbi:MAG: hypothetical protein JXA52_08030 [Planctomycetes bacterium]|nr:hypothetical protein [Planctomycetota bacterium]
MWKTILLASVILVCMSGVTIGGEPQPLSINNGEVVISGGFYDTVKIGVGEDNQPQSGIATVAADSAVKVNGDLKIGIGDRCHGSLLMAENIDVAVEGDVCLGQGENGSAALIVKDGGHLTIKGNFGYDGVNKDASAGGRSEVVIADQSSLRVDGSLVVGGVDAGSGLHTFVQSGNTYVDTAQVILVGHHPESSGSYTISGGSLISPRMEFGQNGGKAMFHVNGSEIDEIRAVTIRFYKNSTAKFTIDKNGITMITAQTRVHIPDDPLQSKLYFFSGCIFDLGFDSPETEAAVATLPMDDPGRCYDLARASAPGYLRWQKEDDFVDHGVPTHYGPALAPGDAGLWVLQEKESDKAVLQAKYLGTAEAK